MDATSTGLVVGLVTAAYAARALGSDASALSARIDGTALDRVTDVANYYAEGYTLGPIALALGAFGRASGRRRYSRAGDDMAASLVAAWGVTWVLKLSFDSRRPNGGRYSFPSGHAASAFTTAPVVTRHFGPVAGAGAYLLAGLTALARLEDRRHHAWDVLAGAAIGLVAGRVMTDTGALRLVVPVHGHGVGVALGF